MLALAVTMSSAALADHGGASAHSSKPAAVSLRGTVVDVSCFALRRAAAVQGKSPAVDCRDGAPGHPAGLMVMDDGSERLYILATPPMALVPHMGRTVRLEGARSPLGDHLIKPEQLEVEGADGGWKPVALLPDM